MLAYQRFPHTCQCLSLRVFILLLLAWGVMVLIFDSKMKVLPLCKMKSQELFNQVNLKENLELRKLISDMIDNKIDKQTVLKQMKKYEIRHSYEVSVNNSEERIIPHKNFSNTVDYVSCVPNEPSIEYETMRRRIRFKTLEMWNFFLSELKNLNETVKVKIPELMNEIYEVLLLGAEHKRSLIADIDQLQLLDGYEEWRQKEVRELSDLVQRRLDFIQNPKDCKSARRLLCSLNVDCGLGCFLHHIGDCFIKSYAEQRTMIFVNSKKWIYNSEGWDVDFKPVSNTCLSSAPVEGSTHYMEPKNQVIVLPFHAAFSVPPPYFPKAIPEDLSLRLIRLDDEPSALWVSYFLKYVMRQKQSIQDLLKSGSDKIGWKTPIVGVHVRRTDKKQEAQYHVIEEYMVHVEDYYLTLEMNGTKQERRIYLATDEKSVLDEARRKYPQYEILCNPDAARLARLQTRFSRDSLYGLLVDVHLLSMSDFVVCTLSSTLCRSVYEIMRTIRLDVTHRFKSLDDIYFYAGQASTKRQAVIAHKARRTDEIDIEIGDVLNVAGNHWNGYSKGENLRTYMTGIFPTFKTVEVHRTFKFPTYTEV